MSDLSTHLAKGGVQGLLQHALDLLDKDGVMVTKVTALDWDSLNEATLTVRFKFLPATTGAVDGD